MIRARPLAGAHAGAREGEGTPAGLLTDIVVEHEYKGRRSPQPQRFTLHPFQVRQGPQAGRYEILHSRRGAGEDPRHAGHVTEDELAQLYARGLVERLGLRLRLRPASGTYPDTLPGKKVPRSAIAAGSGFARRVEAVDTTAPLAAPLRAVLEGMGLVLP